MISAAHTEKHMSEDQFDWLFKYMSKRFDALEAELETKADAERVYRLLDAILQKLHAHEDE